MLYDCMVYIDIMDFSVQVVNKMFSEVLSVQGISRVLYDLTSKPPGTTEWEWYPDN